jgi:hypothetical protein
MRSWAVWNRDKRLGIGLVVFLALCWIPVIGIIVVFLNSLDCRFPMPIFAGHLPDSDISVLSVMLVPSPPLVGCLLIKGSHIAFVCWVLLLVYEFGEFLLSHWVSIVTL